MSDDLLSYDRLATKVGDVFRIEFTDGSIELTLEEVTALPPPRRKSSTGETEPVQGLPVRQQPFTVLFRGPAGLRLPQRTYRMTEPSFSEPLDIFIVPVSVDANGFVYQAIFS